MGCLDGITANVTSACTTVTTGGAEVKAWIINRNDITPPTIVGNKISDLVFKSTKRAWVLTGFKRNINAGHDVVVSDSTPDMYKHFVAFPQYEFTSAALANIDATNDVIIILERKDKATGGDGTFVMFGVENGLFKSVDSRRLNDNGGMRTLEFTSQDANLEKFSNYVFFDTDYATTLANLVSYETPAV